MPHAEGESREITLSLAPRGSTRADPQVEFFGLKKGQLMATLKTHCSVSSVPGRGSELRTPNLSSVYFLDPIEQLKSLPEKDCGRRRRVKTTWSLSLLLLLKLPGRSCNR